MDSNDRVRDTRPAALTAWPTPVGLLRAALRCWFRTLVVAAFLGFTAGYLFWHFTPLGYNAEVRLKIQQAPAGLFPPEQDAAAELQTQANLVKSPAALHRAADEPAFGESAAARSWTAPVEQLGKSVEVEPIVSENSLRIFSNSERAADAAIIVRLTAKGYLNELRQRRVQYLQQLKEDLARESAVVVKETIAVPPTPVPARVTTPVPAGPDPRLAAAEKELAKVRTERREALRDLVTLQETAQTRPPSAVADSSVEKAIQNDPFTQQKLRELRPIEDVIQKVKRIAVLGDKDPSLRTYIEQRDAIRQEVTARRAEIQKSLAAKGGDTPPAPDQGVQIAALQDRAARLAAQEQSLKAEIETLQAKAKKTVAPPPPAPSAPLPPPPPVVRMAPRVDNAERRRLEAEIRQVEAEGVEPFWVTSEASPPAVDPASVEKRQRLAGLGGAAGALMGILFVGFAEFRRRRVTTPQDVSEGLGLPVFGTLPRRLKTISKTLTVSGPEGKSIDALRTALLDSMSEGPCVILVTSPGDGRDHSSLAEHLAASMARSWHKTVLLDGNLRHPALHRAFGLPVAPGFAEVLCGEADCFDVLQPTALNRLWVMPAGHTDSAAIEALSRGDARAALVPLREQFDCVVVDAAALGVTLDALLLAPLADAVVLSVIAGVSCLPEIDEAQRQLLDLGCTVVGAVIAGSAGESGAGKGIPERMQEASAVA